MPSTPALLLLHEFILGLSSSLRWFFCFSFSSTDPLLHMDDAVGPCIAGPPLEQQQLHQRPQAEALHKPVSPEPPVSPVTNSISSDATGAMTVVPEDIDEVWSDAQEAIEADERGDTARRHAELEGDESRADVHGAVSALEPELAQVKILTEPDKSTLHVATVEEPPSSLACPADSLQHTQDASVSTSVGQMSSAPSSPTVSASVRAGPSLEVPSRSASARPVSPTSTQSSHGLERRQSRRRSAIDVRQHIFCSHLTYPTNHLHVLYVNAPHLSEPCHKSVFQFIVQSHTSPSRSRSTVDVFQQAFNPRRRGAF